MSTPFQLPKALEDALHHLNPSTSRRNFLASSGALVLSVGMSAIPGARVLAQKPEGPYPDPDFLQLDTWVVIHPDNTATFFVGKTDGGQGTGTAFRQMMCDELDLPWENARVVMGSTDVTPDQGGSGGSDAIETDGWPMRRTAAEARRVLLELASEHFSVPVSGLTARDGSIVVTSDAARSVRYADLLAGRRFNLRLEGNNVNAVRGQAEVKPVQELRVIGQSLPRYDIPAKVDGSLTWAVDMKVPGMVHARNVRPPAAGALLLSVDEASVASMPGFVAVVQRGNYLAVVFEREEQAIAGARARLARWQLPSRAPFPAFENLFDYMRTQTLAPGREPTVIGD